MSNSVLSTKETIAVNVKMRKSFYCKGVIFKMHMDALWCGLLTAESTCFRGVNCSQYVRAGRENKSRSVKLRAKISAENCPQWELCPVSLIWGPVTGESNCQHRAGSVLPGRGKEQKPVQILVTVITKNILTQEIKPLTQSTH